MRGIIIASAALALAAAAGIVIFLAMRSAEISNPVAEIRQDGEVIKTVSLSEDTTFTIDSEYGSNTIQVSGGAISVIEADCPDKVCVNTGAISGGYVPIICLPHHLEIVIASSGADVTAY